MIARQERLPLPEALSTIQVAWTMLVLYKNNEPRIFLAERLKGPNAGKYTLPGGTIEPEETPLMCAAREMQEETGIAIHPMLLTEAQVKPRSFIIKGETYQVNIFIAYLDEQADNAWPQRTEPQKHGDWKLFPLPEIAKLVARGKLEPTTLKGIWTETIAEILKETTTPTPQPLRPAPAYFLP